MAGFNYQAGRSNRMVTAEAHGMITIGRWAKKHGVSAAAAEAVMKPGEAHHTGTGRRGKSRLTYVLPDSREPTAEQVASMLDYDAGDRPQTAGVYMAWKADFGGPYGRKKYIPVVALFQGDAQAAKKKKEFEALNGAELALAREWLGRDMRDFYAALAALRADAAARMTEVAVG